MIKQLACRLAICAVFVTVLTASYAVAFWVIYGEWPPLR